MDEKKENSVDLRTKKKIIVGAICTVLVVLVAGKIYSSFSPKETAKQMAMDAARSAIEKGKDKLAKAGQGMSSPVPGAVADNSSGNVLKNVESDLMITIDQQPIKADQADKLLMNAITAHDVERTKFYLDSGVSPVFTDNKLCFNGDEYDMPKNVIDAKKVIVYSSANKKATPYTNKCGKMFLTAAAGQLDKHFNKDEFAYYNNEWHTGNSNSYDNTPQERIDADKEKIAVETAKEDVFNLLLSATAKKDYAVLPEVFLNRDVPFSIRKKTLQMFLEANPNEALTKSRVEYNQFLADAGKELLNDSPNNKQVLGQISRLNNPWGFYMSTQVTNFFKAANDFDNASESMNRSLKQDREFKKTEAFKLEVPVFDVAAMKTGVKYSESTNSAFWFYSVSSNRKFVEKIVFQSIYELNNEIELINMIINSKTVNLNYQDLQGNTALHLIALANNSSFNAKPRPMAVLTRYLLNSGVNSNLLNKDGKTAFMIGQENTQGWSELSKAYSDKNYN
jgi:hypothetical protein